MRSAAGCKRAHKVGPPLRAPKALEDRGIRIRVSAHYDKATACKGKLNYDRRGKDLLMRQTGLSEWTSAKPRIHPEFAPIFVLACPMPDQPWSSTSLADHGDRSHDELPEMPT